MRISDWSSDVCSSDLQQARGGRADLALVEEHAPGGRLDRRVEMRTIGEHDLRCLTAEFETDALQVAFAGIDHQLAPDRARSEEHTSELQSLMRISYAVLCLKKKKQTIQTTPK